ncbi:hypothetical protein [Streptomyces sp. NPDC054901]
MTTDVAKAREWLETCTDVSGVEGLVIKSLTGRNPTGRQGWCAHCAFSGRGAG